MKVLREIQQKLKVPKEQYNSFSKFYYRNAEDILEAVKPLLGEATLTLSDEVVLVGDRYYVKATATLQGIGAGDGQIAEKIEATGWAREPFEKKGSDASQITGAASSYARKYALNGLFCIDDAKDADSDGSIEAKTAPKIVEKPKYEYPAHTPKNDASGLPGEDENKINAAKDRIVFNLKALGHDIVGKTRQEKQQKIAAAVAFETDLDLSEVKDLASLEALGQQLADKVEKKK